MPSTPNYNNGSHKSKIPLQNRCPYCIYYSKSCADVVLHIREKHTICRSTSYSDPYHGNGHMNTLEIAND